jgi:hypothetical protein
MVTPPQFWILDASSRLCILLDAFLIEVFPLYGVVFARLYYGGPLLGVDLAVARECEDLFLNFFFINLLRTI